MMAIIGMFFQNGLTGSAWGDWANYADSPLRAAPNDTVVLDISKQIGACPPLGFWDPLGLSKFDDPKLASLQFRRRRTVEIQHGRVAMFACIGYIVPEYFRWPGYLSPSAQLAFEDVPNGLGAIGVVPLTGVAQILAFVGILEINFLSGSPKEYPGDYDGFGALGLPGGQSIANKEEKEKKLLAEINNGRPARLAQGSSVLSLVVWVRALFAVEQPIGVSDLSIWSVRCFEPPEPAADSDMSRVAS